MKGANESELHPKDRLSRLVRERTQMTIAELMPFLDLPDLLKFQQLNKTCGSIVTPKAPKCLRFDILFGRQEASGTRVFSMKVWKPIVQTTA